MRNAVCWMMSGMVIMFVVTLMVAWFFDQQGIVWLKSSMPLICCGFATSLNTICVSVLVKELRKIKKEEKSQKKVEA